MHKILVIDDDTRLRNLLGKFLEDNNFLVSLAKDGVEALEIFKSNNFDLLIVDVMMPNINGIDFTKVIRINNEIPILILSAMGDSEDRIKGLEVGADDYLSKPFEPKELLLRINNILKRFNSKKEGKKNICNFGNFIFSFDDLRLQKNDKYIHTTKSEGKILEIMCKNLSKKVDRLKISKFCDDISLRSVDVQIARLRKKIEENPKTPIFLQTIRNYGYILQK